MRAILDLFCGTGGFSHGIEASAPNHYSTRLGVDVLGAAVDTFKANHPAASAVQGDIRGISCKDIEGRTGLRRGEVSVIVGGPPCQGFSSIRPFRSSEIDDPRNTLFEQFANYVNYFRPSVVVMENVVGLATHKNGETIGRIIECFEAIGYGCDWRLLNAAHFGVPQKRERLILIAALGGIPIRFPEPTHQFNGSTVGFKDRSRMVIPVDDTLFDRQSALPQAHTVMDAIGDLPVISSGGAAKAYDKLPQNSYQKSRRHCSTNLELHSSTKHTPKMLEIIRHSGPNIRSIPKHLISSGFSTCYSRLAGDKPSVTITVNFVHPASNRCIHPVSDRALTPREGARIQSFDDTYKFCGSRTQIVKQIGNAVPPLLGQAVGRSITEMLGIHDDPVKPSNVSKNQILV